MNNHINQRNRSRRTIGWILIIMLLLVATTAIFASPVHITWMIKTPTLQSLTPTWTPIHFDATWTPEPTLPPTATETPRIISFTLMPTNTPFSLATPTPFPTATPNPTQALQAAFAEIDQQFEQTFSANIAYNAPQEMKLDDTTTIELLLNPVLSAEELQKEIIASGNLVTSTAQPGQLQTQSGGQVEVVTSQIEITNQMKAVLKSLDSTAFEIQDLHNDPIQVVSLKDSTHWRWSVKAVKEGTYPLELTIFQLVKYDGKEFWPEVETYKANIQVKVTPWQRFVAWDWKWLLGFIIPGIVALFWRWFESRKKKAAGSAEPPKKRYRS